MSRDLRALAAFLAGVNCMAWRHFFIFNAAGGVVWVQCMDLAVGTWAMSHRNLPGQQQSPSASSLLPC